MKVLRAIGRFLKKVPGWLIVTVVLILFFITFQRKRASWAWTQLTGGWKPGKRVHTPSSRLDALEDAEKKLEKDREKEREETATATERRESDWERRVRERREEAERKANSEG
jgi:hypothetical protein